jgi:catechol 2,3-dioxygenase-like lactoylglutathione lyase family enzyme
VSFQASLVFLFVEDLERSSAFYRSVGLELLIDQGSCRIYGAGGTMMVGLCGGRVPSPDGVIFTLVTDRVEEVCSDLAARGVAFEQLPRYSEQYDITHAFLRDPDGYLVEIQRFESTPGSSYKPES